jgi:hypothetical protein
VDRRRDDVSRTEVSCSWTDLSWPTQASCGPLHLYSSAGGGKGGGVDRCAIMILRVGANVRLW